MTRIILVRHCESEANRAGSEDGGRNSPLSARGRIQAQALRKAFEGEPGCGGPPSTGARLICSHLVRATDTAAAIAAATGLAPTQDPRLGAGETLTDRHDLAAPSTRLIVGAEVLTALREQAENGADPLIVVSHRYPIWSLLTVLYGGGAGSIMERVEAVLGNGGRLEFDLVDGRSRGDPVHRPLRLS